MIARKAHAEVESLLQQFPAVALIGPRQVGKTTLARSLMQAYPGAVYLDLELPSHRARLQEPELYLGALADRLVVLDEVQVASDLFPILRGLIDQDRRPGRFLLLGSASPRLLQHSSETLAGRIVFHELTPLRRDELPPDLPWRTHWWRGGFPEALLSTSEPRAQRWLQSFVRTYVEREILAFGGGGSPQRLSRMLEMLAYRQGQPWTGQDLAVGLGVSSPTVSRHRDQLVEAFLVRELRPLHRNLGKRLVKKPKVYVRDSGLLHTLLRIPDFDALLGHPLLGASFEGYVIEQVLTALPPGLEAGFWRTHAGAEIDLVIEGGGRVLAAVEVKYGAVPGPTRGFFDARQDLGDPPGWVVHPGTERWPIGPGVQAIGLDGLLGVVAGLG